MMGTRSADRLVAAFGRAAYANHLPVAGLHTGENTAAGIEAPVEKECTDTWNNTQGHWTIMSCETLAKVSV